jgi:hypothetical protein
MYFCRLGIERFSARPAKSAVILSLVVGTGSTGEWRFAPARSRENETQAISALN